MIMEKNNSQSGFTLLEVIIAIALLTIGILGAATMQIASIGGNSHANRITEAITFAESTVETLMSLPYDDADLKDNNGDGDAGLDNTQAAGSPADEELAEQDGFTVFWNVAENYPFTDCKTIRVIVQRSDKGVIKTVSLDLLKMRPI
jgi:prepilin-type N-terminal cleavage/methylation domain-containing protein